MRRKSREMDANFALRVFEEAPFMTLSMTRKDGTAYGLPISAVVGDEKTFYFHCALMGEKNDCLEAQPHVCLSAVNYCEPTIGPKNQEFTLQFKSAVAFGVASMVTDDAEKTKALRLICQRFLPDNMSQFDASIARSLRGTAVYRIDLTAAPTGKRKQYDSHGEELKFGRME